MDMKKWDRLDSLGYTKVVDSGYVSNKSEFTELVKKEEAKGHKVVREKTDTKGLIMYVVMDKEKE
jgi:hypothetical protein